MKKMILVASVALLMAVPGLAFGQASLKEGTLYVASSWKGTPDVGYSDVSDSDTESYTETFYSQATSSNPLSVASNNMFDYNANGYRIVNDLVMNWGGNVEGPRHFALEGTLDQVFTLSSKCDWTRAKSEDELVPYSYYWLEDLTHGGGPIDLLSVDAGTLKAGEYRLTMHAAGEWDYSGLSFLHGNGMSITFSQVAGGENQPPVADAGPDQPANEGDMVDLDGSASSDPDGDTLAYEWIQLAGPSVSLFDPASATPMFTAPTVPFGGATLTFQLIVNDGALYSDPDTVDITVGNINHPPVALAGDDQAVAEAVPVTLDGSASYDQDGDPINYEWMQTAGPSVTLDYPTDPAHPTFTAPLVGPYGESLIFKLKVSDGVESSCDSVSVRVENVNHPPIADAGPDQTRNEATLVTLNGTGSSDPDGDVLGYLWIQMGGAPVVLSDTTSPAPSFTTPAVGPAGDTLVFRVTVDDGYGGTDGDEVSITVQDVNSPPACGLARPSLGELWPPNHKMVAVSILGVTDPDHNPVSIQIVDVRQDEPINGLGDGDTAPDAVIQGGTVLLRAERSGTANGRVYHITFMAADGYGGRCYGQVTVGVPHDQGKNGSNCVDDGSLYSALH